MASADWSKSARFQVRRANRLRSTDQTRSMVLSRMAVSHEDTVS